MSGCSDCSVYWHQEPHAWSCFPERQLSAWLLASPITGESRREQCEEALTLKSATELRTSQASQSVGRLKTPCTEEQLAISTHAEIQGDKSPPREGVPVTFAQSLVKCVFLYTFLYIEQGLPL